MPDVVGTRYDIDYFNGLPGVESASARVRSAGTLERGLQILGPIFIKHEVHSLWGLSILHKHWNLEKDERPIQDVESPTSHFEAVTRPRRSSYPKKSWPSVYAVRGSLLEPLEFTTAEAAELANRVLCCEVDFVAEFVAASRRSDLADTFALSLIRSSSLEGELVEFNSSQRASVLREIPTADAAGLTLIQTSWRFDRGTSGVKCESSCWARCTVHPDGSHSGDHASVHNPDGSAKKSPLQ